METEIQIKGHDNNLTFSDLSVGDWYILEENKNDDQPLLSVKTSSSATANVNNIFLEDGEWTTERDSKNAIVIKVKRLSISAEM